MNKDRGTLNQETDGVYFVEEFLPLVRNIKDRIIALNPSVCYRLDKEKISYQIYEDFYDMFERNRYAKQYCANEFTWINVFDDYLKNKLTDPLDKKIDFLKLYGYYIVTMLDPFIICSKNILSVISKKKPARVYLVARRCSQSEFDWKLYSKKEDLTPYLLPHICKQMGIPYTFIAIDAKGSKSHFNFYKFKCLPNKALTALIKMVKELYVRVIFLLALVKRKKLKKNDEFKKILILRDGWLGNLHGDALSRGHQVLYPIYGLRKYTFLWTSQENETKKFHIDQETKSLWKKISEDCIKEFSPSKWPSSEAGIDLSPVLDERFLYFLQKICPIISLSAKQYKKIFEKKKINYIVCQYKTYPSDFGAMMAATLDPFTSSVHIEHGGGEVENFIQYFTELPANIYITSSTEEAKFYDKLFNYDDKNKVKVIAGRGWIDRYNHEAKKVTRRFLKSKKHSASGRPIEKICYLPGTHFVQRFTASYPLCWYYQLQRDLCKHFAELPEYDFIIKVHPQIKWLCEPLLNFLKDLKAPNIFYKEDDLVLNLRKADRVITDYPSTPTYEARLMGLPVFSLYHESIDVRNTAKEIYNKTIVSFKKTEELVEHIDRFLSSDPREYIVSMKEDLLTPTLIEILER